MEQLHISPIVNSLKSVNVKMPGSYAVSGICSTMSPSLSVNGSAGVLSLPLGESQTKVLVALATPTPLYGERKVSYAWQLSPMQFSIKNSIQWSEQLQALVDKVKAEFGWDDMTRVTCELDKLLLYEPGGFFKVYI